MAGMEAARPPDVSEVRELVLFLRGCQAENGLAHRPFDIVIGGMSPAGPAAGQDVVGPLADLGITWWDERMPWGDDLERAEPMHESRVALPAILARRISSGVDPSARRHCHANPRASQARAS